MFLLKTLLYYNLLSDHLNVIRDVINVVESTKCLYLLGDADILDGLFNHAMKDKAVVQISNFLLYNNKYLRCYESHIKISYGGDIEHIKNVFGPSSIYPFEAFSTIVILGGRVLEDVEMEEMFQEAIKKYSVQIIILAFIRGDNEKINVNLRLVNKNVYFDNWEDYDGNIKVIEEYQKVRMNEDMNTKNVRVSVFNCKPFFYKKDNGEYDGIEYLMMNEIVPQDKLEYVYYEVLGADDFWGMITNDVSEDRTDIGMCSQWLTSYKNRNKDFSTPYTQVCGTFLVPKPHPEHYSKYVLLPFGLYVWYLMISFTVTTTIIIYVTSKIEQKYKPNHIPYENFYYSLIQIIRILSQQSLKVLPPAKYWSIRLLILSWIICTLLLTTGYSAGYTSLLTSPRYTKPINTLDDFIQADIHWGFASKSFVNELYKSNDPTNMKISFLFQLETNNKTKNARIAKRNYGTFVKKIKNAFVTDTEDLDENSLNILGAMQECLFNFNVIVVLRKNLPLTDRINKRIVRMVEAGFFKYWFSKISFELKMNYMENFFHNYYQVRDSNEPLTLASCQGVFIFLFCGYMIAIIVFIGEIMINYFYGKYYQTFPYIN